MMPKVLIAGAGATGALCAHILRRDLQNKIELVVWDKARGAGGRMSTSRSPDNPKCTADLGAQYITVTSQYAEKHKKYHEELLSSGILKPFTGTIEGAKADEPGTRHYVTPDGVSSIVKHFLQKSGAKVKYEQPLVKLEAVNLLEATVTEIPPAKRFLDSQSDTSADQPVVADKEVKIKIAANPQETGDGDQEAFDAVVLTMPAGQILQQKGLVQEAFAKDPLVKARLEAVRYSSRFALGLFYAPGTSLDLPWSAQYVQGNPCIRWISADAKKRGVDSSSVGPSLVVHTSVPFGLQHLGQDKAEVQGVIMQHLHRLLPNLPEPTSIKCTGWRYSQVSTPYEGSPGCVFLARLPSFSILASGDAFTHSNLDGCITSAEITCERLMEYFREKSQL